MRSRETSFLPYIFDAKNGIINDVGRKLENLEISVEFDFAVAAIQLRSYEIDTKLFLSWSFGSTSHFFLSVGWVGVLDEIKAISAFN